MADTNKSTSLDKLKLSRRPRVILAPDAYVMINESDKVTADSQEWDFNPYITSISTSLSVDDIGSATITLSIPRYQASIRKFFQDGRVAFNRMDQIHIFMKSRFSHQFGGVDDLQHLPVFWGVVSSVDYSEGGGSLSVTLTCKGILHWWDITTYILNPSVSDTDSGSEPTGGYSNILHNMNPYEIIHRLACHFSAATLPRNSDTNNAAFGFLFFGSKAAPTLWNKDAESVVQHWDGVFNHMRRLLRMHGAVFNESFEDKSKGNNAPLGKQAGRKITPDELADYQGKGSYTLNNSLIVSFCPLTMIDTSNKMETVSKSRLAIAKEVTEAINYEFFMDTDGTIVFKPPYYNMDTSYLREYVIDDEDILRWNFRESEDGIVTRLEVTGNPIWEFNPESKSFYTYGVYEDPRLTKMFGQRVKQVSANFLRTNVLCNEYAVSQMSYYSMSQYGGSITILGRPELKLGRPVFIKSLRMFAYVSGISHDFTFGGSFTTTLNLTAFRRPYQPFNRNRKDLIGAANVVAVKRFDPKTVPPEITEALVDIVSKSTDPDAATAMYVIPGSWEEEVKENVWQAVPAKIKDGGLTSPVIPLSDENGFELIGGFPYGRGTYIDEKGLPQVKKEAKPYFEQIAAAVEIEAFDGNRQKNSSNTPKNA